MTKPFHVGHCARNGLLAALLAREGMTANPAALEHPQGFFAVYNGAGTFDAERICRTGATPLDLVEPGHRLQAASLLRQHASGGRRPARSCAARTVSRRIRRLVESWTHPRRLKHTNRPNPTDGPRRQVQRPIRACPRPCGGHRQSRPFLRRGRARSGDPGSCMAQDTGRPASRRPHGDDRALLRAGARHHDGRANVSRLLSTGRSAATATIRCRREPLEAKFRDCAHRCSRTRRQPPAGDSSPSRPPVRSRCCPTIIADGDQPAPLEERVCPPRDGM